MKLAAGTRVGPYEIEHPIGAGGMGIVYRADDPRLRRKVAIKMLPSATGENFRRFEREARTIGALNHPNLLTLYDVGTHDGTPFLVTEMLDGESLRSRLAKGRLKLREAILIAADVARGLGAAHDAGVIHRDVKPDNIFLTTEGWTKILDFGIAKLRRSTMEMEATTADPADIGNEPTHEPQTADTGLVIGTPGYMAPEQLDGGKIDERTDIFALGVVLYEMIAGRRAFYAENAVEESYAILKSTPDPPKGATKSAARVVMRCLEKRPDARFQSARDLAFALDELDASTDPIARISKTAIADDRLSAVTIRDPAPPEMAVDRSRLRLVGIVAAIAIVTGLVGAVIGRKLAGPRGLDPAWPSVVEGGAAYRRVTYHSQPTWNARLADDGRSVFYSTTQGHKEQQVMRMQIDTPSIAATGIGGRLVDISPKGELAVITDELPGTGGTLSRVVEGGGPRPVSDRVTSATWLPDETLAAIREELAIEAPLGTVIVKRTAGKLAMLRSSRDGTLFAFASHAASGDTQGNVVIVDRTGTQLAISSEQAGIEGIAWSLDGNEVWFSNGPTIFAMDRTGKERVVLRGIIRQVLVDVDAGKILVAPSDVRLKMFTGPRRGSYHDVGWFDASEVDAVSRDGTTIAFVEAGGTGFTKDGYAAFLRRAGGLASQLTNAHRLALLPDASAAIVVSGSDKLLRVPTGVGKPSPLSLGPIQTLDIGDRIAMSWSGNHVVVRGAEAGKSMKLWRIDLRSGDVKPIATSSTGGRHPISPDGETIAVGRATGGIELQPVNSGVAGVPGGGAPRVLDAAIGEEPLSFHGDGTAVFTLRLVEDSIAVDRIDIESGARQTWVRITPEQRPYYFNVVLSADGEVVTYSTNSHATDLYVLEPPVN